MKPSSDAVMRDDVSAGRAYGAVLAPLQDRLLLAIRDGAWHSVSELALWLAPRVKLEVAVERFLASGGIHEKKLPDKISQGQALILQDLLAGLRRKKLLAARTTEAGDEEVQATPRPDPRFTIDREFEDLLPRSPDEVKKLEERLLVEPPRDPLVVWKGRRILVDGHTRFRFYALLGRKFAVVEIDFPDRAAVVTWLYDTHYGRRSYSPEMKSYVRGKHYLDRKQRHGGSRPKASSRTGNLKTADIVAAEYGIGRNTILRDATFAAALDRIAGICGDEVRDQVLARIVRWTRRDVERLARLDQGTVQEVVRTALASGKRPKLPVAADAERTGRKSIAIPLGRPNDQVRALRKVLGGRGLARLQKALAEYFKQRKQAKAR